MKSHSLQPTVSLKQGLFLIVIIAWVLLLTACSPQPSVQKRTLFVFGTLVDVSAYTSNVAAFEKAVQALDETFQRMHQDWHAWKGNGQLVRLNQALASGESMQVDAFLLPLITQSQDLARQSGDLFNPAIGGLITLWGFHSDEPPGGAPPSAEAIADKVNLSPRMADLTIDAGLVSSRNPAVSIDLGAYAKGYALNLAVKKLAEFGLQNTIVNAGGDLCVSGRPGDRPWRIGVRHPQAEGVLASLEVADGECVLTSGNYERYREYEGIRYAHIIDPRNGYPVQHVASATVIANSGGLADAAATALSVAGPERWLQVSDSMGLTQVMLVDEHGKVYMTPAMAARAQFEIKPKQMLVAAPK